MPRPRTTIGRAIGAALLAAVGASLLAGCRVTSLVNRPSTPVVLTGSAVPALVGTPVARVVAFRHNEQPDGTGRAWTQVPVQVDQRKVVGFGSQPGDNTTPGTTGTVYGSGEPGVTALQYADPNTWVGPDPDPALDADDEVVFMVSDAGGELAPDVTSEPAGVMHRSGSAVRIDDPRGAGEVGWVYLFASHRDPRPGRRPGLRRLPVPPHQRRLPVHLPARRWTQPGDLDGHHPRLPHRLQRPVDRGRVAHPGRGCQRRGHPRRAQEPVRHRQLWGAAT